MRYKNISETPQTPAVIIFKNDSSIFSSKGLSSENRIELLLRILK
jgi:hypothetical protein